MAIGRTNACGAGGGIDINGVVNEYIVADGESISAGDFAKVTDGKIYSSMNIKTSISSRIEAISLSASTILLVYADKNNSKYLSAVILTVNENKSIKIGTSLVISSLDVIGFDFSPVKINDDTVLLLYDYYGSNQINYAFLSISGESIQVTGTGTINLNGRPFAIALSPTKVLVAYNDRTNNHFGTASILTVNGNTISTSTPTVFYSGALDKVAAPISLLNASNILISFICHNASSSYPYAEYVVAMTISGTTITAGTSVYLTNQRSSIDFSNPIAVLTETKVIAPYQSTNSYYGKIKLLTINGRKITLSGKEVPFNQYTTHGVAIAAVSQTKAFIVYMDYATEGRVSFIVSIFFDGINIMVGNAEQIFTSISGNPVICVLDQSTAVIFLSTGSGDEYPITAIVYSLTPHVSSLTNVRDPAVIAAESGAGGGTIKCYTPNIYI